ncbi:hypothetical protein Hsw_0303 [Hymenobacter swuensis DY53]|uniref:Uncharacterized protein n=1 Tax=Hymenobacter swuensis DY53 TaxID=1227739 RepID=W8ETP3_9BACT|nr:hypothetical protein Hsw_0303 [Hymenobacter swuensis DY53]
MPVRTHSAGFYLTRRRFFLLFPNGRITVPCRSILFSFL